MYFKSDHHAPRTAAIWLVLCCASAALAYLPILNNGLLKPLRGTALLSIAFVAFNAGYLWLRKDGQFEERAAPTTQLINVLKQRRPQKTVIRDFAYPYPEIAFAAALAAPGWGFQRHFNG